MMVAEDSDESFNDAFDRREAKRIMSGVAAIINRHTPDPERARVEALISRDRDELEREAARKDAEAQVANGVFANLADTVIEPTPEWMAHAEVKPFTPRQPEGTVRTVRTVRRVVTPITDRMLRAGKITDEQAAACDWYRNCYEAAGLDGRYKTSSLGSAGGGGGTGLACAPMAMHMGEVEARKMFREAREAIDAHLLRGFDAVVIGNLPLVRAARFIRSGKNRIRPAFSKACNQLVVWCQSQEIELQMAVA